MNFYSRSQVQRITKPVKKLHNNNSGSSIVTVLIVMALILVLITITLSASLMNYYMKVNAEESRDNFYDAEAALEEIRMGLAATASEKFSECYLDVMQNYSNYDAEKRNEIFRNKYNQEMAKTLRMSSTSPYWLKGVKGDKNTSSTGLYKLLRNTFNNTVITTPDGTGGSAALNLLSFTDDGVVIKNLQVRYTDEDMYVSEIKTDLLLAIPDVNFVLAGEIPDLVNYTIVASDKFTMSGLELDVTGSAYLGKDQSTVGGAMVFTTPDDLKAQDSMSDVIFGGDTKFSNAVTLDDVCFYGGNVNVAGGGSINGINNSEYVISNDLVVGGKTAGSSSVALAGKYFGTGSGISAEDSSAIIVNNTNSKLDLSGLDTMLIGGVSYIDIRKKSVTPGSDSADESNKTGVMMGESISIKPDQRAYLAPADCVAPAYRNGGVNPMTNTQYQRLILEIAQKDYINTTNGITEAYNNTSAEEKTLAKAFLVDYTVKTKLDPTKTLSDMGVVGVREATYQSTGMKYLFLVFDSTESAEKYFQKYYDNNAANAARLEKNLGIYTNDTLKLPSLLTSDTNQKLRDAATNELNFFFRGSLVTTEKILEKNYLNTGFLTAAAGGDAVADMDAVELNLLNKGNENKGLNAKLSKDYYSISSDELSKDVFSNLTIDDMKTYGLTLDTALWFSSLNGEVAYVRNGNIDSVKNICNAAKNQAKDAEGNLHNDATVNVIICDGNVVLDCDFTGLIFASGEVSYTTAAKHTSVADATKVIAALSGERSDKKNDKGDALRAADFLKNSDFYTVGGSGTSADEDTDSFGIDKLVKYANWTKL